MHTDTSARLPRPWTTLVDADTYFPLLDAAQWEEIGREDRPADQRHAYPYSFLMLKRVSRPAIG